MQPDDWRTDMENAPRDKPILAYGEYGCLYALNYAPSGPFNVMSVVESEGERWRMTTPEGGNPLVDVYEQEWDGKQHAYMTPTHWQLLPEPPA